MIERHTSSNDYQFNIIISNYQIDISYYFLKEIVLLQRRPSYAEAIIYRQRLSPKNDHAHTLSLSVCQSGALCCIVYYLYYIYATQFSTTKIVIIIC